MSIPQGLIDPLCVLLPDQVSEFSILCSWEIPAVFALQQIRGWKQDIHEGPNPELPFSEEEKRRRGEKRGFFFLFLKILFYCYYHLSFQGHT